MGRWKPKLRAARAVGQRSTTDASGYTEADKIRIPNIPCAGCQKAGMFLLPGGVGLVRCECVSQGLLMYESERGLVVLTGEGERPARRGEGRDFIVEADIGPCTVRPDDELGVFVFHAKGKMAISPWGWLVMADGVFNTAHLLAPRPPPCKCHSLDARWVDGERGHPILLRAAKRMGRGVTPVRCEGSVWLDIEGFGGRAAVCPDCHAETAYPTHAEFQWDSTPRVKRGEAHLEKE